MGPLKSLLENLVISTEYKATEDSTIKRSLLENLVISTEYKAMLNVILNIIRLRTL